MLLICIVQVVAVPICKVQGQKQCWLQGRLEFFWSLLLKDGEHDRVFLVISDELSFLHDYCYSSLPIYYSKYWLPILGIFISQMCIAFCVLLITMLGLVVIVGRYVPQVGFVFFAFENNWSATPGMKIFMEAGTSIWRQ